MQIVIDIPEKVNNRLRSFLGHGYTLWDEDVKIIAEAIYNGQTKPKALEQIPSAQPVVRCKDCKNFGGGTYCYERDGMWDENDFCSYAERRGEEIEDE